MIDLDLVDRYLLIDNEWYRTTSLDAIIFRYFMIMVYYLDLD